MGSSNGPDKGNTVHACGGNPQNDQIQCASIFNGDFSLFSADMDTDTYNRIGIWRVADLTLSPKLDARPGLKAKVQADFDELVANDSNGNPNNICSQYSTDGNLLYLAVQNNEIDGGVIIVDVSDPTSPAILDAYNDVMAAGCGLVNNPDAEISLDHSRLQQEWRSRVCLYLEVQSRRQEAWSCQEHLPAYDPVFTG